MQIELNKVVNFDENKYYMKNTLHYLLSSLLIVYPLFYPLSTVLGHLGQYFLFGAWLALSIYQKPSFIILILNKTWLYLLFYFTIAIRILISTPVETASFFSPSRQLNQLLIPLVYMIFAIWHMEYSNNNIKRGLVKSCIFSFSISATISLYYLVGDPYAIRRASGSDFAVGDLNLVFAAVCIAIVMLYLLIKNGYKVSYFIVFIISSLLIILASYMTVIVLYFIFVLLTIGYKSSSKTVWSIMFFAIFILIFRENIAKMVYSVSQFDFWTSVIQTRLTDISEFLYNQHTQASGTIQDRLEPTFRSLRTFLNNPIFGVNYSEYGVSTIGHHTQWVDNLARFGIIGNLIYWVQLIYWYSLLRNEAKSMINKGTLLLCWMFYVALGFFNNSAYVGIYICIFFVAQNSDLLLDER